MRNFENYIFGLILAFCLCSCFHTSNVGKVLDRAEMYLTTAPDSAFVALDSLDRSLLNTKELQARHALLYSQALEKVGIEVIMTASSISHWIIILPSGTARIRRRRRTVWKESTRTLVCWHRRTR